MFLGVNAVQPVEESTHKPKSKSLSKRPFSALGAQESTRSQEAVVRQVPANPLDSLPDDAFVLNRARLQGSGFKGKAENPVVVDPVVGKMLRPHQRDGVQFMYNCMMGITNPGFKGYPPIPVRMPST